MKALWLLTAKIFVISVFGCSSGKYENKNSERDDNGFTIFMTDFYKAVRNKNFNAAKTIASQIDKEKSNEYAFNLLSVANIYSKELYKNGSFNWSGGDFLSSGYLVMLATAIYQNRSENYQSINEIVTVPFLEKIYEIWYNLYELSLTQIGYENQTLTSNQIEIAQDKSNAALTVATTIDDKKRMALSYEAIAWINERTGHTNETDFNKNMAADLFNLKIRELPYPPIVKGFIVKPE